MLICSLWDLDLQVLCQPRAVPNLWRSSVCPRPGMKIFALGLPAQCCCKQRTMYLSLLPAKPGFLWIFCRPEECWGAKELGHCNLQFLSSIYSWVLSLTPQRSHFRGATQPKFLTNQWERGIPVEIRPWCPEQRHTRGLFAILHFSNLISRSEPLQSFQHVFARLFNFNNICFFLHFLTRYCHLTYVVEKVVFTSCVYG